MTNFPTAFSVDETPEEVFAAVINVRGWWSGDIQGDTDTLGAVFTYRNGDVHRSTQRITELEGAASSQCRFPPTSFDYTIEGCGIH